MMYMTNLSDLLFSNKELTSGMIVGSRLVKEPEIYGFIPYTENANSIPLDIRLGIITSDRFVYLAVQSSSLLDEPPKKQHVVFPLYRKLLCDNMEHDLLLENLYVCSLKANYYYKEFRNKKQVHFQHLKKASPQISVDDSLQIHYKTLPKEILMYKKISYSIDCVSAVAPCFLVVCRFINSVTGGISYTIYPPEDLFPLSK